MRLTAISVLLSYLLTDWIYEVGDWILHYSMLNGVEYFKIFAHIVSAAVMQFFMNKGYLKYQDWKKNEKVFKNFDIQEETNKHFLEEIKCLKEKIQSLESLINIREGNIEMLIEFVKALIPENKKIVEKE
jgi:hypothetical protein